MTSDYTATSRIVTFGSSTTQTIVVIPLVDDSIQEGLEQFFARLSLADASTDVDVDLDPAQTTIDITDNDGI